MNNDKLAKENLNYYVGIDMGNNIGFAACDENYKLLKKRGKQIIGVHKADEAQTAENRRIFRTTRRRLDRRKWRINWLQDIFNDEIMKKDENFFARLNCSDIKLEDRKLGMGKYSLFNDEYFTDLKFYQLFPTINHLKYALMNEDIKDIRLLYLAVHHIIKYRGHFLNEGEINSFEDILNPKNFILELNEKIENRQSILSEKDDENLKSFNKLSLDKIDKLQNILLSKISRKDMLNELFINFGIQDMSTKNLIKYFMDYSIPNFNSLFGAEYDNKKESLSLSLDELLPKLDYLEDEDRELVLSLKKLYDWQFLVRLLNGEESYSLSMIKLYDEHQQDLKNLKYIIKKYAKNKYDSMFKIFDDKDKETSVEISNYNSNYTHYIGGGRANGKEKVFKSGRLGSTCDQKAFCKYVKKTLEPLEKIVIEKDDKDILGKILSRAEDQIFMPKIITKDNAAFPYQINLLELNRILDKAETNFPFLKQSDGKMTAKEKIISILKFRIPYYVGPTNTYHKNQGEKVNNWIVKKQENISLTPYNFNEIVDLKASNENFITRMTVNCTYLKNAKSLPRNSIIYLKFAALNELNKIKVNTQPISIEEKQYIFDNLYLKDKKPSANKIKIILSHLRGEKKESFFISGFQDSDNIKCNLEIYLKLKDIIGDLVDNERLMEDLIFDLTVLSKDLKTVELKNKYGKYFTEKQIKDISALNISGWGTLSLEFLKGSITTKGLMITDKTTGQVYDIIELLYETNLCLQEIIYDKRLNFEEALTDYFKDFAYNDNDITFKDVEEMYCSPSVKRSIWRSYKIIKEIEEEIGYVPQKIFIESTRKKEPKKGMTESRKIKLVNLYNDACKLSKEFNAEITSYIDKLSRTEDNKLNSESIFLYYMQLGRCAYSGEELSLERLSSDCDIDHIIPQHYLTDDSIHNNKVLVLKKYNQIKKGDYPVPASFLSCKPLWDKLKKIKLMTDEKYNRLVRRNPLTDNELQSYINRQIVEVNQSVILLKDLLKRKYGDKTEIILTKANNISNFRKKFELTKSREVNDFHHGADAYLNIVVGNILNERFNHSRDFYKQKESPNLDRLFDNTVSCNNKILWDKNYLPFIKKQINSPNYLITYKTGIGKGELYKQTIFKAAGEDNILYSQQESKLDENGFELHPKHNTEKYGGLKTSGTAYFVIVDYSYKKEIRRRIVDIPIFYDKKIKDGKMTYEEYFKKLGLKNATLANIKGLKFPMMKVGDILSFKVDNYSYLLKLAGANEEKILFHNANELYVNEEINNYIKELSIIKEKVDKYANNYKEDKEEKQSEKLNDLLTQNAERKNKVENKNHNIIILNAKDNLKLYDLFVNKISNYPYKDIPSYLPIKETLINARDVFRSFVIYEQITCLLNILKAFQCNALKSDISNLFYLDSNEKKVKGSKFAGSIGKSKDFLSLGIVSLIFTSISGIKERTVKISI